MRYVARSLLKASSSRRGDGRRGFVSGSKARFLSGNLYCSCYRCSWWPLELIVVISFSLDFRYGPGLRLGPESPLPHTMTPGVAVCRKDFPGFGIYFSGPQVAVANILQAKEWSNRTSDALPAVPRRGLALASDRFSYSVHDRATVGVFG